MGSLFENVTGYYPYGFTGGSEYWHQDWNTPTVTVNGDVIQRSQEEETLLAVVKNLLKRLKEDPDLVELEPYKTLIVEMAKVRLQKAV